MIEYITRLLKSIKFWTIVGAIATVISLVYMYNLNQVPDIKVQFGNYTLHRGDTIGIIIAVKDADTYKYGVTLPLKIENNSNKTFENFSLKIISQCVPFTLNDEPLNLMRIVNNSSKFSLESNNELITLYPENKLPSFSCSTDDYQARFAFFSKKNSDKNNEINIVGIDHFNTKISISYDGVNEPFNTHIVYAILLLKNMLDFDADLAYCINILKKKYFITKSFMLPVGEHILSTSPDGLSLAFYQDCDELIMLDK